MECQNLNYPTMGVHFFLFSLRLLDEFLPVTLHLGTRHHTKPLEEIIASVGRRILTDLLQPCSSNISNLFW